jgi:hypothetical protein
LLFVPESFVETHRSKSKATRQQGVGQIRRIRPGPLLDHYSVKIEIWLESGQDFWLNHESASGTIETSCFVKLKKYFAVFTNTRKFSQHDHASASVVTPPLEIDKARELARFSVERAIK